jgi:hypothetical protein
MPQAACDTPVLDVRSGGDSAFAADLAFFQEKYTALWRSASTETPDLGERKSGRRQRSIQRATDRLVDDTEADLLAWPSDRTRMAAAAELLRRRIRAFGADSLGLPPSQCAVIFSDAYLDATADFARRARAFDPALAIHDLFQAMRNVWIMNLLQLFLGREPSVEPAMVGYSLLYPYTDNRLDRPDLGPAEKLDFCARLERRLRGEPVLPRGGPERAVWDLVAMVESQFEREVYPEVYSSLLAIHGAQVGSLRQQSASRRLEEHEILTVSVAKGGASVLADGHLVGGRISREEADFFFGYGVVLQLTDDLQDVKRDAAAGHQTLFSTSAPGPPRDRLTSRLFHFLDAVLDRSTRFADPRYDVLKDVVRTNCAQLIVQSAGQSPRSFSSGFLAHLESASPWSFRYARRKRRELLRRYERLDRRIRREGRLGSLFDALAA